MLAFGTNAGVDEERVKQVLDVLGPQRMVVLVNIMGPFARVDSDNTTLELVAKGRPNVVVADWADAIRAHPDQVQSDRVHPTIAAPTSLSPRRCARPSPTSPSAARPRRRAQGPPHPVIPQGLRH